MIEYKGPFQEKNEWYITVGDGFFSECRINDRRLIEIGIAKGSFEEADLVGVESYRDNKRVIISFPAPKKAVLSEWQEKAFEALTKKTASLEKVIIDKLALVRRENETYFPVDEAIQNCVEIFSVEVGREETEGIAFLFHCDWNTLDGVAVRYLSDGTAELIDDSSDVFRKEDERD